MSRPTSAIRAERSRRNSGLLVPLACFLGLGALLVGGALIWERVWSDDAGSTLSGSGLEGSAAGWLPRHRSRPATTVASERENPPAESANVGLDAAAGTSFRPDADTAAVSRTDPPPASGAPTSGIVEATDEPVPRANAAGPPIAAPDGTGSSPVVDVRPPLDPAPPGWTLPPSGRLVVGTAGDVELRVGPGRIPVGAEMAPLSEVAANPADAAGVPGETTVVRSASIVGDVRPLRSALHLVGTGSETRVEVVVSGVAGCANSFQLVLVQVDSPSGPLAPSPSWVVGLRTSGAVPGCAQRDVVVTGSAPAELVDDRPAASIIAPSGALR